MTKSMRGVRTSPSRDGWEGRLGDKMRQLGRGHDESTVRRAALDVLGSSVIRVFAPGTKMPLAKTLERVQWRAMSSRRDDRAFRDWFSKELARVASTISRCNKGNSRLLPGLKWGHAAKVLTLFLRDIVYRTHLLSPEQVDRIGPLLYVPVDGRILMALHELDAPFTARKINEIATSAMFDDIQGALGDAAVAAGVPRVWFDDVWVEKAAKGRRNRE